MALKRKDGSCLWAESCNGKENGCVDMRYKNEEITDILKKNIQAGSGSGIGLAYIFKKIFDFLWLKWYN